MERISSDAEDGLSSSQDGAKKRRRNGNATHLGGKRANTGIKNNLRRLQAPPGNGKTDGVAGAAKKTPGMKYVTTRSLAIQLSKKNKLSRQCVVVRRTFELWYHERSDDSDYVWCTSTFFAGSNTQSSNDKVRSDFRTLIKSCSRARCIEQDPEEIKKQEEMIEVISYCYNWRKQVPTCDVTWYFVEEVAVATL